MAGKKETAAGGRGDSAGGRNNSAGGTNLPEQFAGSLSQAFLFCESRIQGKGEDSALMNISVGNGNGICGVFDGCGGSGSRVYAEYGGHTGAYISSRVISEAVNNWYERWRTKSDAVIDENEIKREIDGKLRKFDELSAGHTRLRGLTRDFPSTAALFIFRYSAGHRCMTADIIWAGDSRVYALDAAGLHQLTEDDVRAGDPMLNLRTGNVMSNVVSASGKYELHRKRYKLDGQSVIFAATDGCFEYVPSPMHFEYLLLRTLDESESLDAWKESLMQQLGSRAGDDMSMAGILVNFNTFRELRRNYRRRLEELDNRYIRKYEILTDEEQLALWDEYKTDYLSSGQAVLRHLLSPGAHHNINPDDYPDRKPAEDKY